MAERIRFGYQMPTWVARLGSTLERGVRAPFPAAALLLLASVLACGRDNLRNPGPPVQPITRVELDSTRTLEVIGLRHWTLAMIQDSLAKLAPGVTLDGEGCATALREQLRFADAACVDVTHSRIVGADTAERTIVVVSVREPGDSARVKFVDLANDQRRMRPEWSRLTAAYSDSAAVFSRAYRAFLELTPQERSKYEAAGGDPLVADMVRRTTQSDFNAAASTLIASFSEPDRAVAALLLTHFPDREETWHSLLQAAMDAEQGRDAMIAAESLQWLARHHTREVDWDGVSPEINRALDGTALASLGTIVSTLLLTRGANRGNARAFLKGGGEMITAWLESSAPPISEQAHALLRGLRGVDLGRKPGPWRTWIASM